MYIYIYNYTYMYMYSMLLYLYMWYSEYIVIKEITVDIMSGNSICVLQGVSLVLKKEAWTCVKRSCVSMYICICNIQGIWYNSIMDF
jgi:hypothetical protein